MCVRELRKTETANVSVFYLSFCSTIGAICGCFGPKILGFEHTVRVPYNHVEWLLLLGVGEFCLFRRSSYFTGGSTRICHRCCLSSYGTRRLITYALLISLKSQTAMSQPVMTKLAQIVEQQGEAPAAGFHQALFGSKLE